MIVVSSKDAERIAKSFADLINAKGLNAIRRRAVNQVGAKARRELRARGPLVFSTSAAALSVQGQSAPPGADDPAYRLRMASRVPVARLRAKARRVTRSRGRRALSLTLPGGKVVRFRSIHREGARFILRRAGPLPQRAIGGVFTNPRQALGGRYPELAGIRREGERELPALVSALIDAHLSRRRR